MARNYSSEALILSVSPQGENNRSICIFTPEDGISYAVLYGGPKSKMRSLVSPWNRGILYLYKDEVRRTVKITDFDVHCFHLTFRENLFKSWSASLASEMMIKTRCAGSPAESWTLMNGFLDGLDLCDENNGRLGLIRFLWRYLGLLGIRPDISRCNRCSEPFFTGNFTDDTVLFSLSEYGFLCMNCADPNVPGILTVSREALCYLAAVSELSPKEVRAIHISAESVNQMKQLVFILSESAAGTKLASIESGIGIL